MTYAHKHEMSDETREQLTTTVKALRDGGQSKDEAMAFAERACAGANCEFDPHGIEVVEKVYGAGAGAGAGTIETTDAVPEDVAPGDSTPADVSPEIVDASDASDASDDAGGAGDAGDIDDASKKTPRKKK